MRKNRLFLIMTATIALSSCVSTTVVETKENQKKDFVPFTDIEKTEETIKIESSKKVEKQKEQELTFIQSISDINIKIINAPREATVGNEFVRPFTLSVSKENDTESMPLADFPITIRYPSSKENGELLYTTENVKTDKDGIFVFTAPRTSFSAAGWFSAYPTYVPSAEFIDKEISEELKIFLEEKSVNTQWLVKSDLASKGGILVVWEFNERDRFQGNCSDLMSELRSRNVKNVTNAPYSDSSYIGQPMENVYRDNASLLADMDLSYGYMIYGTIKFSKDVTPNEDGTYSCALVGDIQAIDMKNGSVIMHKTFEQEATGKGWNDVVGRCKSKLMSKIVDSLLYEL